MIRHVNFIHIQHINKDALFKELTVRWDFVKGYLLLLLRAIIKLCMDFMFFMIFILDLWNFDNLPLDKDSLYIDCFKSAI